MNKLVLRSFVLTLMLAAFILWGHPERTPPVFGQDPDVQGVLDYTIDLDQDGLPDQLVSFLTASSVSPDDFVARLPYTTQTRETQKKIGQLGQNLLTVADPATYQALEAEIVALQAQMESSDPNYALTLRTMETLAWQALQEKAVSTSSAVALSTATANQQAPGAVLDFDALSRGDIIFLNDDAPITNFTYAMVFNHVAMIEDENNVYEANKATHPQGVRVASYEPWKAEGNRFGFGKNNKKDAAEVVTALDWAKDRWGVDGTTPYNTAYFNIQREDALYCSQLVWKIHQHINTDLRLGGEQDIYNRYIEAKWGVGFGEAVRLATVSPDAIALDDDVTLFAVGGYDYHPRAYLPDVRTNGYDNWHTQVVIRNNTGGNIDTKVIYLAPTGAPYYTAEKTDLAANAIWQPTVSQDHQALRGSAIVYATGEVSVIAYHKGVSPDGDNIYGAYTGVNNPSANVHVPLLLRKVYGIDSSLSIQNAGNEVANITVKFHRFDNGNDCTKEYRVQANGVASIDLAAKDLDCLGNLFVGSAHISNDEEQPLAMVATQEEDKAITAASNAHSGGSTLYAPLVQYGQPGSWNIFSSGGVQNLGGSMGQFTTRYYNVDGSVCGAKSWLNNNIAAHKLFNLIPMPPDGNGCIDPVVAAKIDGHGQNWIGWINQRSKYSVSTYEAIGEGSQAIKIPYWHNTGTWDTGLSIQNLANTATTVTITYYNANGSYNTTRRVDLKANGRKTYGWDKPTHNFHGSALVTSDNPIVVTVNVLDYAYFDGRADGLMSYTPIQ